MAWNVTYRNATLTTPSRIRYLNSTQIKAIIRASVRFVNGYGSGSNPGF